MKFRIFIELLKMQIHAKFRALCTSGFKVTAICQFCMHVFCNVCNFETGSGKYRIFGENLAHAEYYKWAKFHLDSMMETVSNRHAILEFFKIP